MSYEVLRVEARDPDPSVLARAGSALRAGEIVVFPTETVYGLGVLPDAHDAADRLNRLKGRAAGHPLAWHLAPEVPLEAHLEAHSAPLTPLGRRLCRRFLPGPLTLVLASRAADREVGIRMPRHAVCEMLLDRVGGALLGSSANRTGRPPAASAEDLDAALLDGVALVIDAGPSRYRCASTVVRPRGDRPEILREGAIPAGLLLDESGPCTLVVCSGNTCRSPMAAALLSDLLRRRIGEARRRVGLPPPPVRSAGLGALDGLPASGAAVLAMSRRGLDLTGHVCRRLAAEDVLEADLVLTVSEEVAAQVRAIAPAAADRVAVLGPDGRGIRDPFGGPIEEYVDCAERIQRALEAFLARYAERFEGCGTAPS
ncbi:MAG: Sua5/YciO/YrdC/YwlC family protein [Planctomycetes bacterium]|nr:Sua5/YciO/YrdC/YwlC family protein [Planctomycetota bacterium]